MLSNGIRESFNFVGYIVCTLEAKRRYQFLNVVGVPNNNICLKKSRE